tara:strand:- start:56 stop:667 length:612 start_codon:yes stop_codon:yes gene_type:complete
MSLLNKKQNKVYHRQWLLKNKEHMKEYRFKNRKYRKEYMKIWRLKNEKKLKIDWRVYYLKNRQRIFKYKEKNKERDRINGRKHYYAIASKRIKQIIAYQKEKYRTDIHYRYRINLRKRFQKSFRNSSTIKLVGCTKEKFWKHLEKQFEVGMTKENYGRWHIDHIKPCASFDLTCPKQQLKCFNYKNLQPLWASENLSKGAKIL